mgnify:CR=1 FL=1
MKVYCYERCSTCKKALKWLDEKGIEGSTADIKTDHPDEETLRKYHFVSGLPLLFVELKRNDVDVENAYIENYTDYLDTIPFLFHYNAFLMLSNGMEAKIVTLGSKYELFHEF